MEDQIPDALALDVDATREGHARGRFVDPSSGHCVRQYVRIVCKWRAPDVVELHRSLASTLGLLGQYHVDGCASRDNARFWENQ
jgi:hypothetical protein